MAKLIYSALTPLDGYVGGRGRQLRLHSPADHSTNKS